jgi:hypothetical protein
MMSSVTASSLHSKYSRLSSIADWRIQRIPDASTEAAWRKTGSSALRLVALAYARPELPRYAMLGRKDVARGSGSR